MIPQAYRAEHEALDYILTDMQGLTNVLNLLATDSSCIQHTHADATSINVLIRHIEAEITKALAHQEKAWAALCEVFHPKAEA